MTPDAQRIYQLIIDAGGAKAGADMFKAAAEQISAASAKAATAGKPLADSVAAVEKSYSRLVNKVDPVSRAQIELARDIAVVERAFAAQKITVDEASLRITQIGQRYDFAVERAKRMQQALGAGAGGASRFGTAIQQAGFQVGDFAVQVASGQGILRPFIQQGTQLISMFGPWGAVIGAAGAVVGALATSFMETEDATKGADDALDAYNEAVRLSAELTKSLHDANDRNVESLKAERRYRLDNAEAALAEAQAKIAVARADAAAAAAADPIIGFGEGVDTTTQIRRDQALKSLEAIKKANDEIILQQRKLAAENKFGGEMMDPFAAQGGDFTSSYYDPTKKPKGTKEKDSGADAIADLQQQIALHGTLTREEKALYETSMGRYKDESAAEKEKILQLARILDLKEALTDEEKKSADISKRRDAAEIAEYDQIISDASQAWDARVKRGAQLTNDAATPAEKYLATVKDLGTALIAGTISQETYNRQIAKAQDAFDAAADGTSVFRDAADDAMGILQAGLIDAAFEADNLKEALAGVLEQLAKMAANKAFGLLADKGIDALFGLFSGGGGGAGVALNSSGFRASGAGPGASAAAGGFFSWLGGLFGFSGGGVMTSAGPLPLRQYSGGGIANTPQVAMFAEGGVPEAYVPVPNGMIPVEIRGGGGGGRSGGGIVITNNIKIEGSAGTPDQNNDLANKMQDQVTRAVKQAIDSQLADQQRSGGLLSSNSMGFG